MKSMLVMGALAVFAGCNAAPTSAPTPTPVDAGPPAAPQLASKSGDRLKLRPERGSDGSLHVLDNWIDSKFNEVCESSCGSDGKRHCLPSRSMVLDGYFGDKDCTQRIATVVKGRPTPPHAALMSKEKLTGNAYSCEFETQSRIFKVEGEFRESYLYLKNEKSGGCSKITEKEDSSLNDFMKHMTLFSVSAEVSPSEFVLMTTSGTDEQPVTAPVASAPPPEKK